MVYSVCKRWCIKIKKMIINKRTRSIHLQWLPCGVLWVNSSITSLWTHMHAFACIRYSKYIHIYWYCFSIINITIMKSLWVRKWIINDGPVDVDLVANQAGGVAVGHQGLKRHHLEMFKQVPIALVPVHYVSGMYIGVECVRTLH